MSVRLLFTIFLVLGIRSTVSCTKKSKVVSCYSSDKNPYLQFGPSTSYSIARGKIKPSFPECEAMQVWMVARHGTRYPDTEDYESFNRLYDIKEQILANHNADKVSLCQEDINNLKKYDLYLSKDDPGKLTEAGKKELFELGFRLKYHFTGILNDATKNGYQYFSTDTHRTIESAEYFTKGVTVVDFNTKIQKKHKINQNIIHTYSNCKKWQEETKKYKEQRKQFRKNGKLMQEVQRNVSNRLGFKELLDIDSILTMYDACRLQKAWTVDKISPWCAVFNKDELKVLEYGVDLYFYYKSGPGTLSLHKKLACPAVKDMIDTFSRRISNPTNEHYGIFYFTHHIMVDVLQVGLELSKPDNPPTPDNYSSQQGRQYRSSKTMPFAGNILAVLYKCGSRQSKKVVFYRNEEIVQYPGCDNGLCDWEVIEKKFHDYVNHMTCTDMKWCNEGGK